MRASNAGVVADVVLYVQNCAGKKRVQGGRCYKPREADFFLQINSG